MTFAGQEYKTKFCQMMDRQIPSQSNLNCLYKFKIQNEHKKSCDTNQEKI